MGGGKREGEIADQIFEFNSRSVSCLLAGVDFWSSQIVALLLWTEVPLSSGISVNILSLKHITVVAIISTWSRDRRAEGE